MNKTLLCAAAAVAGAVLVVLPATASAAPASPADPVYTAENATGGIYWRYYPYWADSQNISGWGFYQGDQIDLSCYVIGGPVAPYGNTLWYIGYDISRAGDGWGYINDHFLNTPGTAANPDPVAPPCGGEPELLKP